MMSSTYDESSIKALGPVEAIRRRPSMYIGSTDSEGVFHLFKEVADNAVDESLQTGSDLIAARIEDDGTARVMDRGRGIPVGKHPETGESALVTVLTRTHAGAKFDDESYRASIGTHGVGLTAVNALSEKLCVSTFRNGGWTSALFREGELRKGPLARAPDPPGALAGLLEDRGTVMSWRHDPTRFQDDAILDPARVREWARLTSMLAPGLRVVVDAGGEVEEFRSENGLEDYVNAIDSERRRASEAVFRHEGDGFDVCLSFVPDEKAVAHFYTNTSRNEEGGTHANEFWKQWHRVLSELASSGHEFALADVRADLTAVFNVRMSEPKFRGQTKEKLADPRGKEFDLATPLAAWLKKRKSLVEHLCDLASGRCQERNKAATDKALARSLKKEAASRVLLPGKLTSAPKCKPAERELYLVEGDSAGGGCKSARNHGFQEVLTLRGKLLNVCRAAREKTLANREIMDIMLAVGYDPLAADPLKGLRVGKIVLLSDPDPDGWHIDMLLLALFAWMMPKAYGRDLLHVAETPEFMATHKGRNFYGRTKEDLAEALPKGSNATVRHIKGWGEVDARVLREVAFDPETRKIRSVRARSMKDVKRFMGLMSWDLERRKELIGLETGALA